MASSDKYSDARYGDIVSELFGDWNIIFDKSTVDYSGSVDVLFEKHGVYKFVEFSYGSCSGCDGWESERLSDPQIGKEILKLTMTFDSVDELKEYASKVDEYSSLHGMKIDGE